MQGVWRGVQDVLCRVLGVGCGAETEGGRYGTVGARDAVLGCPPPGGVPDDAWAGVRALGASPGNLHQVMRLERGEGLDPKSAFPRGSGVPPPGRCAGLALC